MEAQVLLRALSDPSAYPTPGLNVEVRQTHISIVCLTNDLAYKIRKSVKFPFLDFSSLELRRIDCEREVELNRRLARDVYLGVVPVVLDNGKIRIDPPSNLLADSAVEVVDWAVKMQRLPESATLKHCLLDDKADAELVASIGQRLARFHQTAASGEHISRCARFEPVSRVILDNLEFARTCDAHIVSPEVLAHLEAAVGSELVRLRDIISSRAELGRARDTHGDLRLDHIYLFPNRAPPDDFCVIDCIEFNDSLRYADPVADIAFLVMELKFLGRKDLAAALVDAYFTTADDAEGRALLALYVSYRAAVRAKVTTLELREPEISTSRRVEALEQARAFWLLSLAEIERPSGRPCLLLVGGLQGTGKTTLALALGNCGQFSVIRTDVVRKELARQSGIDLNNHSSPDIYTSDWTRRTYAECLRRANELLEKGQRVIVDGTFSQESFRHEFLEAARRRGLPRLFLECHADPEVVHKRLDQRVGDESDADWQVYLSAVSRWEPTSKSTSRITVKIDCSGSNKQAVSAAVDALRFDDLLDADR